MPTLGKPKSRRAREISETDYCRKPAKNGIIGAFSPKGNYALKRKGWTYLVLDPQTYGVLGNFTLMIKAYLVESSQLSSKIRRLVERFSQVDKKGKFIVPVYLIAQLGKNFALPKEKQIAGVDLLKLAIDRFSRVKGELGGKLVMVEREADSPKLLEFYTKNGFKSWTRRINEKDGKKKVEFDQMFAVLNDEPPTGGPGS